MGAETERCSRHDGFYPKQTDLYRQFFIIRTSFVRKVLNICPLLPFQAPKNSLYIFWKWDSLMPISPYIKFKSWTVELELYNIVLRIQDINFKLKFIVYCPRNKLSKNVEKEQLIVQSSQWVGTMSQVVCGRQMTRKFLSSLSPWSRNHQLWSIIVREGVIW